MKKKVFRERRANKPILQKEDNKPVKKQAKDTKKITKKRKSDK